MDIPRKRFGRTVTGENLATGLASKLYPSLIMGNSHSDDPFVLRIEERRFQGHCKIESMYY
jgi:hypothetical protein